MRPPRPRRSREDWYHEPDITEGVTDVAIEAASMLFLGSSESSTSALTSWLEAIETSYKVGSPEGVRLEGGIIVGRWIGFGASGPDWTESGRLKFIVGDRIGPSLFGDGSVKSSSS